MRRGPPPTHRTRSFHPGRRLVVNGLLQLLAAPVIDNIPGAVSTGRVYARAVAGYTGPVSRSGMHAPLAGRLQDISDLLRCAISVEIRSSRSPWLFCTWRCSRLSCLRVFAMTCMRKRAIQAQRAA